MPTLYVFARVQLTRFRPARRRAGGVRFTRLRRKARHHLFSAISLPKALLPPDSIVLHELRRMRKTFRISSVVCNWKSGGCVSLSIILGTRSTQSAWKQCGARHARLNRVTRTIARRFAQSTSEWSKTLPRGFKGPQPLGTPFSSIFRRAAKDGATGGRSENRMPVKT